MFTESSWGVLGRSCLHVGGSPRIKTLIISPWPETPTRPTVWSSLGTTILQGEQSKGWLGVGRAEGTPPFGLTGTGQGERHC